MFSATIVSCGKDSDKNDQKSPADAIALVGADLTALGKCDQSSQGKFGYVSAEKKMYLCDKAAWTPLDTNQDPMRRVLDLVYAKAESAVLSIECEYEGGAKGHGTGTKINDNQIITAFHVVDKAVSCIYKSNKLIVASGGRPILPRSGRDIAIIEPGELLGGWNEIQSIPPTVDYRPKIGELLLLSSLPKDFVTDKQYTFGYVTDDTINASLQGAGNTAASWRNAFTSDMAAAGGSSGAPVFNAKGQFFGIHVGGDNQGTGLELNYQLAFDSSDFQ